MWIQRNEKRKDFINKFIGLKNQVLILRGARQVGKTAFVENVLNNELSEYPQVRLNLLRQSSRVIDGKTYFGRDFLESDPSGEAFLNNLEIHFGKSPLGDFKLDVSRLGGDKEGCEPILIFIDEADQHPMCLEMVQTLAELTQTYKVVITGSNIENIHTKNAATGRQCYFDLYPISFLEFLQAKKADDELKFINSFNFNEFKHSEHYHKQLESNLEVYLRLGGMPKILSTYLDPNIDARSLPEVVKDLTDSIEKNVKTVLDNKYSHYEYLDVLRTLATLSLNTLKYKRLQVNHAGVREAKRLVLKTVGARVAHKIRLIDSNSDLSKYILFDSGIVNCLLNGSDLLKNTINKDNWAIMLETFVGNELIKQLPSRDDLFYWKSHNKAEVEFFLRSPALFGVDVKSKSSKDNKSLNSLALLEQDVSFLVKLGSYKPTLVKEHIAKLPRYDGERSVPLLILPVYLAARLMEIINSQIAS